MKVRYIGPFDEVLVADLIDPKTGYSQTVKRHQQVDVDNELGARLLEQDDNWAESPAREKPKTDSITSEE